MVIEKPELTADGEGWTSQQVRLYGDGRPEQAVEVRVPTDLSPAVPHDATAAVPLALLLAMRFGEDLEVAGRVDRDLHARLDLIQSHYRAMDSTLRLAKVRVEGLLDSSQPPAAFAGACLSRGVDSLYACARGRTARGPIDCAVFVDGLEPIHDATVREQELELAQRAAEAMGLPLVIVGAANLRSLTDGTLDWEDACGAGLAWIAHALAGGLSRLVVPSTDSVHTLGPCGTSPVLDPLFSSRRMEIEHGDVTAARMEKVDWLASHRPDLLPLLKVCYEENRPDNCGRCSKCLHTMACLRIAGALEQATGFPPTLDLEAVGALAPSEVSVRYDFARVRDAALGAGDRELAATLSSMLARTAADRRAAEKKPMRSFRQAHSDALLTILRAGRDDPDVGVGDPQPSRVGLLRTVDLRARRHSYTTSACSAEVLSAELGALVTPGGEAEIGVWIVADGRVVTDRYVPPNLSPDAWARLRFCALALFAGKHKHPLARRIRLTLRRVLDAFLLRPPAPARVPESGLPLGCLFEDPGEGRVALWSGVHPVLGDQLLTWSSEAVERAGYVDGCLLGYLEATAPHTGQLGARPAVLVPWVGAGEIIEDGP